MLRYDHAIIPFDAMEYDLHHDEDDRDYCETK